jgi:hypothetical protein
VIEALYRRLKISVLVVLIMILHTSVVIVIVVIVIVIGSRRTSVSSSIERTSPGHSRRTIDSKTAEQGFNYAGVIQVQLSLSGKGKQTAERSEQILSEFHSHNSTRKMERVQRVRISI